MPDYKIKSIYLLQGILSEAALKKIRFAKGCHVFVSEGRPTLEAGHTVTRVLLKCGIIPTVISDNMAGFLFFKGLVKEVVLACHHADNKGALCDIGALILAVLAHKHKIPLKLLPARHRIRFLGDPKAVLSFEGKRIAPQGAQGYVPLVEWVGSKYLKRK
ncbi:MAG: hypothetical protein HQL14_07685 [Candidatus Omnitrophica bacterium]|nr:hypothetical protein [Candidatus Omnitrophota bacterium]